MVLGIKSDSMDRYLVRMNESLESVKTLNTCSLSLTTWYLSNNYKEGHVLTNMESMIHYFKLVTEGYTFTLGQTYLRQESPKGELGCYLVNLLAAASPFFIMLALHFTVMSIHG